MKALKHLGTMYPHPANFTPVDTKNTIKNFCALLALSFILLNTILGQPWSQYVGSTNAFAETFRIEIDDESTDPSSNEWFEPQEARITAGTTVIWFNEDTFGHRITSGNPSDADFGSVFDSGLPLIQPGTIFQHKFDKPGVFPYFCPVYPWMVGKVIVTGESSQISINASTQASNFKIGDTVRVSGSVNPVTLEQPVVIQVFNPTGTAFMFDEVRIDASGSFAYDFKIEGKLATTGNYRIDIGYLESKKSLTINVKEGISVTTGKITISSTGLVDATGSNVSEVFVDQQVLLQSRVSNNQDTNQEYAYIVQIKNSDDIVVSLSWVQGSINPKQSLNVAQSWLPDSSGTYSVQIFVWQSVTDPIPLTSAVTELRISVSA